MEKDITVTKELKIMLLNILKKGIVTTKDKNELLRLLEVHTIPIVLADGRTYEDLKKELRDGL